MSKELMELALVAGIEEGVKTHTKQAGLAQNTGLTDAQLTALMGALAGGGLGFGASKLFGVNPLLGATGGAITGGGAGYGLSPYIIKALGKIPGAKKEMAPVVKSEAKADTEEKKAGFDPELLKALGVETEEKTAGTQNTGSSEADEYFKNIGKK